MDIHLGRGNANKLMNRFLVMASRAFDIQIAYIDGGGLRNAIPRESISILTLAENNILDFEKLLEEFHNVLISEYLVTDPNISLSMEKCNVPSSVMTKEFQKTFLAAIYACPNGIYRMSPSIKDLVQTSNNLARVYVENGVYKVLCLTRSSVDTEKMDEAEAIRLLFEIIGAEVALSGSYPGWTPKPNSDLVKIMSNIYQEIFEDKACVNACHAGLECGILGANYPAMKMISFGPNIRGAHSPDESVQISSVQKFWKFLLETLNRL